MTETIFVVESGDGERLEVLDDEDKALNARARWMDGYPNAIVKVYKRITDGRWSDE